MIRGLVFSLHLSGATAVEAENMVKAVPDSSIIRLNAKEDRTEQFDVLDCRGEKTGEIIGRDEAHRTETWHGAFHCLIVFERAGRGYALFQKRAPIKKIAPDRFDVSVGGHYASGEDASIAGPREMKEELGLDVRFEDLVFLGRRLFVYRFTPGVTECEFQDVFLYPRTILPEQVTLQQEEVAGLLELEIEEGLRLFGRKITKAEGRLFRSTGAPVSLTVATEEFVPCLDNYYLKMLLLAKRYFGGERYLVI